MNRDPEHPPFGAPTLQDPLQSPEKRDSVRRGEHGDMMGHCTGDAPAHTLSYVVLISFL